MSRARLAEAGFKAVPQQVALPVPEFVSQLLAIHAYGMKAKLTAFHEGRHFERLTIPEFWVWNLTFDPLKSKENHRGMLKSDFI